MLETIATGFVPDPEDAAHVLAFVLCPARAFLGDTGEVELAGVAEALRPVKSAAIRRWSRAAARRRRH